MNTKTAPEEKRNVGILLILGILFIPYIFSWYLLRKGHTTTARVVGFSWLAFAIFAVISTEEPKIETVVSTQKMGAAAATKPMEKDKLPVTTPAAPAKKPNPVDMLAKDSAVLARIETRLKENEKSLKGFYGTASQLEQASKDGIQLIMMKVDYLDNGKSKEEKAFGKKASTLLSKVSAQRRQIYASTIEESFVKNGLDIKVTTTGTEKNRLKISYVLMSKPMVYKFQNEIKIQEQATKLGFSRITYTNGFDSDLGETWTVDL
ncbi:MAG: hypothetical protein Q7T32_07690 [Moraxellaceae bacterium]|nr:hypothetical protein [Moraxellaceae bacterium]